MAIKLSTHRCVDCFGKLEFNKIQKVFECPYCGRVYEKDMQFEKIQIDGLAGINDTARAVLLDIANQNFDSACKNLDECEKLNHNYIGTWIANICYYLFMASANKSDAKVYVAKSKYYLDQIKEERSNVEEDEKNFYDVLTQPEIYAVVYATFLSVGLLERASYIANFLEFDKILNSNLNKILLNICLKANAFSEVDQIVSNIDFIDKRYTLYEVLKHYPDTEQKISNIKHLFEANAFTYKDTSLVKKYIEETNDSSITKLEVMVQAFQLKMDIDISEIIDNILDEKCDDKLVERTFSAIKNVKLSETDAYKLLDYCMSDQCTSCKVAKAGIDTLKANGSIYEIRAQSIINLFNYSKLNIEEKNELVSQIFQNFRVSQKGMDLLSNFLLLAYEDDEENRYKVICPILEKSTSITLNTMTDYLIGKNKDGNFKIDISKLIFSLKINEVYFKGLLSNYLLNTTDSIHVVFEIIKELAAKKCDINQEALKVLIVKYDLSSDMLTFVFNMNIQVSNDLLEIYLKKAISNGTLNANVIAKLLNYKTNISNKTISDFILKVKDNQIKTNFIGKLIQNCSDLRFASSYTCSYLGHSIVCNFIQNYFFTSVDEPSTRFIICKELMNYKIKLSDDILVDKKKKSFKKYILENKSNLSTEVVDLCDSLGVFKMFF